MKYVFPALINKDFEVTFPDLPGCFTDGEDLYDALRMAEDVLSLWLVDLEDSGEKITGHDGNDMVTLIPAGGMMVALIPADTDAYRRSLEAEDA